jgi:hypothetical protein
MTARVQRIATVATQASAPQYELRVRGRGLGDSVFEVWELPSPASPRLSSPERVAGLHGRNLELVEHRVLRRLVRAGIKLGVRPDERTRGYAIPEDIALTLGLLFRTLAPMRKRETMRTVAEGIEAMGREEAAYWLGMAVHRKNPRRVLTALRYLLTEPRR